MRRTETRGRGKEVDEKGKERDEVERGGKGKGEKDVKEDVTP